LREHELDLSCYGLWDAGQGVQGSFIKMGSTINAVSFYIILKKYYQINPMVFEYKGVFTLVNSPPIKVENVVALAYLYQPLDLESIYRVVPGVEYNPERFPGLIYRLRRPRATVLVFSSGKMVCAGANSERKAKNAINKILSELKGRGIVITRKPEIVIQNIVATSNLGFEVDLEDLAQILEGTIYEPEQFPGLIYRMREPEIVALIFSSGKIVCAGAKEESQLKACITRLASLFNGEVEAQDLPLIASETG
ncbi:MAG: TATA-box-binding protein, partial [Candidatus Bathyarchaeia archaeon]